ncbi:iron ABC transporter ATP-binding protein (plasmid) [Rhizobium sp. ACO-34A]|nr:iron ABC transporter ATP-binding protein [Rhizobium sp. ACO-34A]
MQLKPAVRLDNVGRTFGDTAAAKGISLEIASGEIVSLVGHSGCGKSTLLRIIAGVEAADTGRVFLGDRMVDGGDFVEPERRGIGFVFQDYALFPHLSARDNILFGLKRGPRREALATVSDIMARVGITHLADRFPHTLSGGEQQRVALARALAPRPSVILLDEPFSNLDQGLRERVRTETLSVLRSAGTTVIMVTHDPEEALSSGDRVVLMRAGEIVQAGTPRDIYGRPGTAYVADFFGTFNRIPGSYRDGRFETAIGSFVLAPIARREGAQTLYVRPNAIRISADMGDYPARIEERIFLGASEKVVLRVEGLEHPVTAILTEPLPDDAETVKVSIRPEALLAF